MDIYSTFSKFFSFFYTLISSITTIIHDAVSHMCLCPSGSDCFISPSLIIAFFIALPYRSTTTSLHTHQ